VKMGAAARDFVAKTADWSAIGVDCRALVQKVLREAV